MSNTLKLIVAGDIGLDQCLQLRYNDRPVAVKCTADSEAAAIIQLTDAPFDQRITIVKQPCGSTDQLVTLLGVTVDGTQIPEWLIRQTSSFHFAQQILEGCLEWQPPGTWSWNFQQPIITWILDQKIAHESKYNQDYKYPWSYKLGPDSVETIGSKLQTAIARIDQDL